MATKYALCALAVVALLATAATAEKGKKGKGDVWLSCLTTESLKATLETTNATMAACLAELGLNQGAAAEATTTGRPSREAKHPKHNMCVTECMFRKSGLVKDGSFVMDDYASANVKAEHQEQVKSKFTECLTKEGLSAAYTVNKDDQCKSLDKYGKCLFKAAKVCKANNDGSS